MAVTFALQMASRYQLRYTLIDDGQGGAGNLDAATMIADALDGTALQAILGTTVATQAAARTLAFDNSKLLIEMPSANRDANALWIIDADTNANALRLILTAATADALGTYLVITFVHSIER